MRKVRITVTVVFVIVASFLSASPAMAQAFQLCNTGDAYCTPATSTVDLGTTASTNPTFDITLTSQSTPVVDLVALIPDGSSVSPPNFTASFNSGAWVAPSALGGFSSGDLWSVLSISKGAGYNFSSFTGSNMGPDAGLSGFQVYEWQGIGTDFSSSSQIAVSFSSGTIFPEGSRFLAVGTSTDNIYDAKTPNTTQLVVSVPEYGSKGMLFLSALVLFVTFSRRSRWLQL